jgi:hypothetical protein
MKVLLLGFVLLAQACSHTVVHSPVYSPDSTFDSPAVYTPGATTSAPDPLGDVKAEFCKGHHRSALRLLGDTPGLLNSDARAQYLAGYSWIRLHRTDLAKPFLSNAASGGFNGFPGWESTEALLGRIAVVERLRPPPAGEPPDAEGLQPIRAFADDTPWIRAVVKALPDFVSRSRAVFGQDLPPIDFYLFRSRESYTLFYKALFGVDVGRWWQNGTGDSNAVVFCQVDRQGVPLGPPGAPRGIGDVLHEYSHALLNTFYGDGYLGHVPQWLDEGLSDFTARPYYRDLFETSAVAIHKALGKSAPPTYEDLSRRLYERDSFLRYSVARYMVEEMMKGRETGLIREILERAAPEGRFDEAIQGATETSPREFRERVIARFR